MMHVFLNPTIYLFTFCLIFLSSCGGQLSETSSAESGSTAIEDPLKHPESLPYIPRVDSVLQFSVMVTSIFEDSKGNFWFGSHGDGLCRYDGKQFTYFTANHGLPSGTDREFAPGLDWSKTKVINGGNQVGSIQEDQNGIIWIKTHDNICKFNGQTFTAVQPDEKSVLSTNKSDLEWEKEMDDLWFGNVNGLSLYRYDGKKLEFLTFPSPYHLKRDGISEVYKDQEGSIWFGTMDNGTFRYNGKSLSRINKESEIGVCRSVFQDKTGRVWITNNRFGLMYLEDDTLTNFIEEYSLKNNDNLIVEAFGTGFQAIEQAENGDLWFGTFGNGIWKYDASPNDSGGRGGKLTHFTDVDSSAFGISKTIFKDRNNQLWFSLGEGTVYGFNGKSFYRFDERELVRQN